MTIALTDEDVVRTMQGVIDLFLIPKFIELGMNASGRWISSLEARSDNLNGQIWGVDYTLYLANGRAGGKRPPIAPIISWVGYKLGLSGAEAVSTAWAIATKIGNEGTSYYPNGTDLLEVLKSKEVTQYVYDSYKLQIGAQVKLSITKDLKRILLTQ